VSTTRDSPRTKSKSVVEDFGPVDPCGLPILRLLSTALASAEIRNGKRSRPPTSKRFHEGLRDGNTYGDLLFTFCV